MSLAELSGTPKYETYIAPNVNIPSPVYVSAVEEVNNATPGTIVSRKRLAVYDKPDPIGSIMDRLNPLGGQFNVLNDASTLLLGTNEEKAELYFGLPGGTVAVDPEYDISMGDVPPTVDVPIKDYIHDLIETKKETEPGAKEYFEGRSLFGLDLPDFKLPDFKLPDFGDLGKWALIGLTAIAGIFLFSRLSGDK